MRHDTPDYRMIASCLAGGCLGGATTPNWDWEQTIHIAAREEVLPSLHGNLLCPPEIADFFEGIHDLNAERNSQLLRETETLALLLNKAGIEPVLLKGTAYLVTGVYRDPADRWLYDIDFLVSPLRSAEAFEIIRRAGYEPYIPDPTALVLHHHPTLEQADRIPVEIHHSLGHGACSRILTAAEIIDASTPFHLGRANVRIPSPDHLMTHLIVHSQMQHGSYYRIWPSLRAMYDLVSLGRHFTIDWNGIRARFRTHGKAAILNLHLMQVEKAMGTPPPFPLSRGGLRWQYRQALWREPRLRFIDPMYTCSRVIWPKIRLSWRLLRHPVGRKYVLSTLFRPSFYRKLFGDIAHG